MCAEYQLFAVMPLFPRSGITRRQAALRTDHPQRGNRFEALRGMRQHVCGGQQPGEILPRLRGKDTPQTESPKREKQAFTDKNNYIASTANEYPFARNARASHRERGHFACIGNKNKPPAMQVCSQTALASSKKPPCYNEYKVRQPNHYNKEESKWTIIVYHTQNGHANII